MNPERQFIHVQLTEGQTNQPVEKQECSHDNKEEGKQARVDRASVLGAVRTATLQGPRGSATGSPRAQVTWPMSRKVITGNQDDRVESRDLSRTAPSFQKTQST